MTLPEFLGALQTADGNAWCSPPGLGTGWKVKSIRSGLGRRVLVEHDGALAFARNLKHVHCKDCRGECIHCHCSECVWWAEVDGRSGPRATPEQIQALLAKLRNFELGRLAPVVALDD